MLRKIKKYINEKQLIAAHSRVIVGVSGGADSVALLDVLTLCGYDCIAAHCNFHLRGDESERDATFVKKWCKSIDIPFQQIDFDTHQYAADRKISIEMAARELRYEWFEMLRRQYRAAAIAVAHHRDDAVETVLLNLSRGTGIKGLTGIAEKNGYIVRPLLCVSREEIESYLAAREIPFVTDSTNREDTYRRNAIRLNVLPLLRTLNPSVDDAIWRTAQNVREAYELYAAAVDELKAHIFFENKINISKLLQTASPQSMLFELLTPYGFNGATVDEILRSLDGESGKIFFSENYRLIKDRDTLILDKTDEQDAAETCYLINKDVSEINAPIALSIKTIKNCDTLTLDFDTRFLYADADKIEYPLILRRWQSGDWFIPFGMKGKKKLSDYFTDRKFSLLEKAQAWILTSGENIVWIVGERSDNRYRITQKTRNILQIEYKKQSF